MIRLYSQTFGGSSGFVAVSPAQFPHRGDREAGVVNRSPEGWEFIPYTGSPSTYAQDKSAALWLAEDRELEAADITSFERRIEAYLALNGALK